MKTEYKTIVEKAAEWSMTVPSLQTLCRNGKITGAFKDGGVWYIPDKAPIPNSRRSKDTGIPFLFTDAKEKIFTASIDLFVSKGFSNVSLKEIASSVNMRQGSLYHYFNSKQDILDTIYGFFCHYYQADRPSLEDMEELIKTGSVLDIMKAIKYEFHESYKEKLFKSMLILYQEKIIDPKAREITKKYILDDGIKYVEDILNMGIETGRFPPFDVHAMAVMTNAVRLYVMHAWIVDPSEEGLASLMRDDQTLYQNVVKLLTDIEQSNK